MDNPKLKIIPGRIRKNKPIRVIILTDKKASKIFNNGLKPSKMWLKDGLEPLDIFKKYIHNPNWKGPANKIDRNSPNVFNSDGIEIINA